MTVTSISPSSETWTPVLKDYTLADLRLIGQRQDRSCTNVYFHLYDRAFFIFNPVLCKRHVRNDSWFNNNHFMKCSGTRTLGYGANNRCRQPYCRRFKLWNASLCAFISFKMLTSAHPCDHRCKSVKLINYDSATHNHDNCATLNPKTHPLLFTTCPYHILFQTMDSTTIRERAGNKGLGYSNRLSHSIKLKICLSSPLATTSSDEIHAKVYKTTEAVSSPQNNLLSPASS